MRHLAASLLLVAAGAATGADADAPMTPDAFENASVGRTLHFTYMGQPFGSEQYFSGRRVLWRFSDGSCQQGSWWGEGSRICFDYANGDGAQCWAFHPRPSGFAAALLENGSETGFVLDLAFSDSTPLDCPGPDVGS